MGKLTAIFVRKAPTGRHLDGQGLYLVVDDAGRRYWQYRYQRAGRERGMSLGSADDVALADARKAHAAARALLLDGKDPLEERDRTKLDLTRRFADVAEGYIADHEARWHGPRSAQQWRGSLRDYAYPRIGKVPVAEIGVQHVLKVLKPIWGKGEGKLPETASRVRGRLEAILDYAAAMGWRTGPNPAIWRGGLRSLLPAKSDLHTTRHYAALDWRDAPEFMAKLGALHRAGMASLALAFLVYTAARSGEVRGATWDEFDIQAKVWTIPAGRMKARREHRVPLAEPAMAILQVLAPVKSDSPLVFFGIKPGKPLADVTLKDQMRRLGFGDKTVHGWRSCFRDWAADTGKPSDLAEAALAHVAGNAVVQAYQRSDLLDARRVLMDAWAAYLLKPRADVVPLRPAIA
jgi:integrase